MDIGAIGGLIGGLGQFAGGVSNFFKGGGSTPDTSSFYQNWRNDDMAWAREQFNRNEALQREFAQNGIRWRVEDAKAAGLHPLAAIGAAGAGYSPTISAGGGSYNVDFGRNLPSDTGASLANMGQGLGRAISATQTPQERAETAYEMTVKRQQIASNDLDLQIKAAQLARYSQPGQTGGGVPIGQSVVANSHGVYEAKPYEATTVNPGAPYAAAGPAQSENEYRNNSQGGLTSYPSSGMNIDEMGSPGYLGWMWRNRVLPFFGDTKSAPPRSMLPPGAIGWVHHFGEWHPNWGTRSFRNFPQNSYPYRGTLYGSKPPVYERD